MFKKISLTILPLLLPIAVFAQTQSANNKLEGTSAILKQAKTIISDTLLPMAFFLALLYFFYGVAKYIKSEGAGKAEGKGVMQWGIVALFVISSIWGIVSFIRSETIGNTGNDSPMQIPTLKEK